MATRLAAAAALCAASGAHAQAVPKTVRLIVAYPAGGVSDVVARALGDKLAAQMGITVVVENKAGASGAIGMDAVAKAAPDGATLGFSAISPLVLNPHLGQLALRPAEGHRAGGQRDVFAGAADGHAGQHGHARLAPRCSPMPRRSPGAVRWATSGPASLGTSCWSSCARRRASTSRTCPYKGGGQQLNDALGGQFEVLSTNAGRRPLSPQIQAGKLRPLAVGAPARLESLPQVPTLAELGYPAANLSSLFGVLRAGRHAGHPDRAVQRRDQQGAGQPRPARQAAWPPTTCRPAAPRRPSPNEIASEYETNGAHREGGGHQGRLTPGGIRGLRFACIAYLIVGR